MLRFDLPLTTDDFPNTIFNKGDIHGGIDLYKTRFNTDLPIFIINSEITRYEECLIFFFSK